MLDVINEQTVEVPVSSLKTHPQNPRKGDVGLMVESIESNGFYGSIIVQKSTGYILVGNHRYKAALELGAERLPVTFVDVDDDRALRIMLADNRVSDVADYDESALAELLMSLNGETELGLEGTGFDEYAYQDLLDYISEQGAPPSPPTIEPPVEPRDERGDGEGELRVKIAVECSQEEYEKIRYTVQAWLEGGLKVSVDMGDG